MQKRSLAACAEAVDRIVPIPGTTKLHRLEESIGAATVELSAEDLSAIEAAQRQITVVGDRYPAHLQQRVDR